MSLDSGIRVEYVWQTRGDARVCPFCNRLHNHMWDADGEEPLNQLNDQWGAWVWDIGSDVSRIHDSYHVDALCRCYIDYSVQILWEGNWVDFGQYTHELQEALRVKRELESAGGGAASGGGYLPLWHMTQGAGYLRGQGGAGRGGGSDLLAFYQLSRLPMMAQRIGRGQISRYDIFWISRNLPRILPAAIAAPIGAAMPPLAVAMIVGEMLESILGPMVEEAQRPERISEAYRERVSARERERAWNRYRTPYYASSGGGAR